jgi:DNA-binding NtrC family response regulator
MNRYRRILLLHYDEQVLIELERLLEDMGIETTTTWDMAEAVELASTRHYDLMVVGEHSPEVSASAMLRELQCRCPSLPCVVVQSRQERLDAEYYYSLGAAGVVKDAATAAVGEWVRERLQTRAAAAAAG